MISRHLISPPSVEFVYCSSLESRMQQLDFHNLLFPKAYTDLELLRKVADIYDQVHIANHLNKLPNNKWTRETINRWLQGRAFPKLSRKEYDQLKKLLPKPRVTPENHEFKFIDLFAGIGGIRMGFEEQGGLCVFSSEWDKFAIRTYKANFVCDNNYHNFNEDIRDITLSQDPAVTDEQAYAHIDNIIPDHDVLLAGFPCQPFSIAGVSKKNSLGVKHGFACDTQGTLFFDVVRILAAKRPSFFVLENVKNLKSHDRGRTFKIIMRTLDELGYHIADSDYEGTKDPKIINGANWLPQNRERIILVGFRKDLELHKDFSLADIPKPEPKQVPRLGDLLEPEVDEKYILSPRLWKYLFDYARRHRERGNGFGYGLVGPDDIARTLSARYYKDGSEILVDRGFDFNKDFDDPENMKNRPRRLTPIECARLMGFSSPTGSEFIIPVSDTQAYKQFGNSVIVPLFKALAAHMKPYILRAREKIDAGEAVVY